MKAYIARKINGDTHYWGKFVRAEDILKAKGFTVINPAVLPEGMCPADYMRICFAMIDSADVIVFLHDWEESKGARLEWTFCEYIGKKIMYFSEMEDNYA